MSFQHYALCRSGGSVSSYGTDAEHVASLWSTMLVLIPFTPDTHQKTGSRTLSGPIVTTIIRELLE